MICGHNLQAQAMHSADFRKLLTINSLRSDLMSKRTNWLPAATYSWKLASAHTTTTLRVHLTLARL